MSPHPSIESFEFNGLKLALFPAIKYLIILDFYQLWVDFVRNIVVLAFVVEDRTV